MFENWILDVKILNKSISVMSTSIIFLLFPSYFFLFLISYLNLGMKIAFCS